MNSLFNQKSLDVANYQLLSDADIFNIQNNILARWQSACENSCGIENEIQHQHNFLQDFFVKILGYQGETGNQHNTLWWESGTNDGRRPDGILGFNLQSYQNQDITTSNIKAGDIRAVIELKASNVNLDKNQNRKGLAITPIEQGFLYAPKVGGKCEWVIVSNFAEIRLYKASDSSKYHSFFIAELAKNANKLKEFHFLLAKDRLFTKQHNQSPVHSLNNQNQGIEIERKFYAHYSALRYEIWQNLIALNQSQKYGRNFYLYKAQKLIDRIIFIRFCKENSALNNDAVLDALNNKYTKGKYNRLKLLFTAMDEGNPEIGIAKFNGGLFSPDSDLDILNISDEIIDKIVLLYSHDFGSDLDVNILGHIFEQSISDLENLTGNQQQQRKKDGVFYTPAYITQYIVQEAVGGWLADKQTQIKATQHSYEWWQQYASALKSIKVLDPACGSGAFLVKVFDYLQEQWQEIAKHININYSYHDILTNNIYGVDINPASVGITKLSLWLKTAHHRQPLTALDGNIKIGNSLIDDPDVAGYYSEFEGKIVAEVLEKQGELLVNQEQIKQDKHDIDSYFKKSLAFKWKEEFAQVFKAGGFDVVVGNPPWVSMKMINEGDKKYYSIKYVVANGQYDLFALFVEKAIGLSSSIGFIVPDRYINNINYKILRKLIIEKSNIQEIVTLGDNIFENVNMPSSILVLSKYSKETHIKHGIKGNKFIKKLNCSNINDYIFDVYSKSDTLEKITIYKPLSEFVTNARGVEIGKDSDLILSYNSENSAKFLIGENIARYKISFENLYIRLDGDVDYKDNQLYRGDKILIRKTGEGINATFDNQNYYVIQVIYVLKSKYENLHPLYLLSIINSKVALYWYHATFGEKGRKTFPHLTQGKILKLPIPQISLENQQPFIEKAQAMLDLTKQLNDLSGKFLKLLSADLAVAKISKKLEKWHSLNTNEFFAEVGKQNKSLALLQKSQWLEHFETQQQQAIALQNQITCTDNEIDQMVYQLYQLTEEEIATIESQNKDN
jgi:type I restriction-modification system DNA methylase subunit